MTVLYEKIARIARDSGVLEATLSAGESALRSLERGERRDLFLLDAVRSAAEVVGTIRVGILSNGEERELLERKNFRLFLMRLHQYLDVHSLLSTHVKMRARLQPKTAFSESGILEDPRTAIKFDAFYELLSLRPHMLRIKPGVPSTTVDKNALGFKKAAFKIFDALCIKGRETAMFNTVVRWSVRTQCVRPGSGASVTQKRWPTHGASPGSVSAAMCHSARCRDDLIKPDPKAPKHRPAPPLQPPKRSAYLRQQMMMAEPAESPTESEQPPHSTRSAPGRMQRWVDDTHYDEDLDPLHTPVSSSPLQRKRFDSEVMASEFAWRPGKRGGAGIVRKD